MIELLWDIWCVLFYTLFFISILMKVRNMIHVEKKGLKAKYRELRKNIKTGKKERLMFKISVIFSIMTVTYVIVGALVGIVWFVILVPSFGLILYEFPTFLSSFSGFTQFYFSNLKYMVSFILIAILLMLIRSIVMDYNNYKKIKGNV